MTTATFTLPARRFAWKEYRTLRSLWLAVAALAVAEQFVSAHLALPGSNLGGWLFASALAATALYAVGAASILFAVEYEDETYNFLTGLPTDWLSVFAGKVLLAVSSALALAVALTISAWAINGGSLPSSVVVADVVGVFGIAILECLAWGTLFSLLAKRPLVAALLTLVVAAVVAELAVAATGTTTVATLDPRAYSRAAPIRLAIACVVLLLSVLVARRWLTTSPATLIHPAFLSQLLVSGGLYSSLRHTLTPLVRSISRLQAAVPKTGSSPRRALTHLLWQSWHQSWKALLAPLPIALFLSLGVGAIDTLAPQFQRFGLALGSITVLFLPALYGALAFGADQHGRQYRFLAEHAARPRYVWLARQAVWGGALTLLALIISLAIIIAFDLATRQKMQIFIQDQQWRWNPPGLMIDQISVLTGINRIYRGAGVTLFAALLAYAIGQFCSMLSRSQIMAAFLACAASVFVTAWAFAVYYWDLSWWLFLLPPAAGFLIATWLRAPDWIVDRNSWREWLLPVLAIATPLATILVMLPSTRLLQVSGPQFEEAQSASLAASKHLAAGNTPAARDTAAMYLHAADLLCDWEDPLDPWLQYREDRFEGEASHHPFGLDPEKVPSAERDAFDHAVAKHRLLEDSAREAALNAFLEASRQPTCHFELNPDLYSRYIPFITFEESEAARKNQDLRYEKLMRLLSAVIYQEHPADREIELYLAGLRATRHLRSNQSIGAVVDQLHIERDLLESITRWAARDDVTNDQRRDAIRDLLTQFAESDNPSAAIYVDAGQVRSAILGDTYPRTLRGEPTLVADAAYIANELPWERKRALREIDLLAARDAAAVTTLSDFLQARDAAAFSRWDQDDDSNHPKWNFLGFREQMQQSLWPRYRDPSVGAWDPAALSLARLEYGLRVPTNVLQGAMAITELYRRATLLQIALAMYHHDHGQYPESLESLVPDYLDALPLDPYSGKAFQYLPHGLDLPLVECGIDGGPIEPHTPLLWSVGAWNLRDFVRGVSHEQNTTDTQEPPVESPAYRLGSVENNSFWGGPDHIVFPLPK